MKVAMISYARLLSSAISKSFPNSLPKYSSDPVFQYTAFPDDSGGSLLAMRCHKMCAGDTVHASKLLNKLDANFTSLRFGVFGLL